MRRLATSGKKLWYRMLKNVLPHIPVRLNAQPDFIIIGAQKAGTTSLYAWLTAHPDVLPARRKELHYFNRRWDAESARSYWLDFPSRHRMAMLRLIRRRSVVTGEASTLYLPDPLVPQRAAGLVPDVKLIAVLRDPVDRAISNYWMEHRRGREPRSLEESMRADPSREDADGDDRSEQNPDLQRLRPWGYVTRGRYAEQLERWLAHFPRSQLLIIEFDDMATDAPGVYRRVLDFIGVDPDAAPLPRFEVRNAGSRSDADPDTINWLRDQFREPNQRLDELVGINYNNRS